MRYLSVCSGIEAATVAWHSLGWTPTAFSEIEKFPSQVLAHHYPNTPNVGDMTKYKEWNFEQPINLLVGGTPCQSFSVAGLRKGLEDPRGNLALTYCGILDHFRPKWFVWENVPGVLSSGGGRDFGSFLGALAELGYGFAYRVLDAQYFGVAQRRRRVFVVGCLGDWRSAAKVLFEPESLRRDSAPSRKAWEGFAKVAGTLTSNGGGLNRPAGNANELDFCIPTTSKCLTRGIVQRYDFETESFIPSYGIPGNWIGRKPENGGNAVEPMNDIAPCLTKTDVHGVAQPMVVHGTQDPCVSDIAFAQGRNSGGENVLLSPPMAVRRLTPKECERLQGFPDNYTDIKPSDKDTPDSPRYKALGNSMAVPVMAWIGKRIQEVENS
jgi:DNA (cytosine-5)-methyltransferase 1